MYSLDLSSLNPEQSKAVTLNDRPLLLLAGAGSGKTRVITFKIAHLIANLKVPQKRVLALTFTNKAAQEMKERVVSLLDKQARGVVVTTFHSLCVRFLREYIHLLGYHKNFVIFDTTNQLTIIKNIFKELDLDDGFLKPKPTFYEIMKIKGDGHGPEYFLNQKMEPTAQITGQVFKEYQKTLKSCNALDFEDILYFTLDLFKRFPAETEALKERFEYVMVDEYQDTNRVQYQLIKLLSEKTRRLCVVGDDDQSIYGWRGADIRNILDFQKDFPEAEVIRLEQNYRSTDVILKAANGVIGNNKERMAKQLWTEDTEGEAIDWVQADSTEEELEQVVFKMRETKIEQGLKWSEFAFLYRSNFQSRAIEEVLRNEGIPYQLIGGLKFFDRKEIQDCIAYMKFLHNTRDDVNLLRVINYPKRGIGTSTIAKLNEGRAPSESLFDCMVRANEIKALGARAKSSLKSFTTLVSETLEDLERRSFYLVFKDLFERIDLKGEIERDEKTEELREKKVKNYLEFINTLFLYGDRRPEAQLIDFLDYVSLFTDQDQYDETQDKISLLTIHSAKGLEFDFVAITGLTDGQLPNQNALDEDGLEEERRLFYVAITRARKRLLMSMPLSRMFYGEWIQCEPSRFIYEIEPKLFDKPPLSTDDPEMRIKRNQSARSRFFNRYGV